MHGLCLFDDRTERGETNLVIGLLHVKEDVESSGCDISLSNHPREFSATKMAQILFAVRRCRSRMIRGELYVRREVKKAAAVQAILGVPESTFGCSEMGDPRSDANDAKACKQWLQ